MRNYLVSPYPEKQKVAFTKVSSVFKKFHPLVIKHVYCLTFKFFSICFSIYFFCYGSTISSICGLYFFYCYVEFIICNLRRGNFKLNGKIVPVIFAKAGSGFFFIV